jgi:hypothetical protein
MWIIRIMAGRKCAPSARYFQALHGGKIVWTVKDDWSDGKISDHFMNLVHGEITDLSGHKLKFYSGGKIDFGNGKYTIVQIADRYEDFGINGLKDLLDADKEWHRKIKKGEI